MVRSLPLLLVLLALAGCDEAAPVADPPPACARAGGDWEFLGLAADTLYTVGAVAQSPYDPDLLLAATRADFSGGISGWLFRSEDDGQTWQSVLASGIYFAGFLDTDFDAADPSIAYSLPYGVSKSVDGGRTWFRSDAGIRFFDARAGAFLQDRTDPTGQTLLAGTYGTGTGDLYRSTDGAQTWVDLSPSPDECQGPGPPGSCSLHSGIISLVAAPSQPAVLYAGTNFAGDVLRSEDAGVTWEALGELPAGLPRSLLVDAAAPDIVYVAALPSDSGDPAAYRSGDGGQTFEPFVEGLPDSTSGGHIVQDPATGVLYLTGSSAGGEGMLWRRGPGEGAWTELATPVIGLSVYAALHLTTDGWLYVGGEGLWRVETRALTTTEAGPCEP